MQGVYWGAARFFEMAARRAAAEKKANPGGAKRKRAAETSATQSKKATGDQLLARIAAIDAVPLDKEAPVFDTCVDPPCYSSMPPPRGSLSARAPSLYRQGRPRDAPRAV